jgi:F-type H+-transporting ATPase subunit b
VIEINWTIWLQFANFFVLMLVLNVLLYRPIRAVMERRRDTVEGAHRRAKDLENQINEKMDRYQGQLQEAKLKGAQEKAVLRRDAAAEEARILSDARGQAGDHVQTIKNKVAAEAAEASSYLKGEAETLASHLASKVLGRGL